MSSLSCLKALWRWRGVHDPVPPRGTNTGDVALVFWPLCGVCVGCVCAVGGDGVGGGAEDHPSGEADPYLRGRTRGEHTSKSPIGLSPSFPGHKATMHVSCTPQGALLHSQQHEKGGKGKEALVITPNRRPPPRSCIGPSPPPLLPHNTKTLPPQPPHEPPRRGTLAKKRPRFVRFPTRAPREFSLSARVLFTSPTTQRSHSRATRTCKDRATKRYCRGLCWWLCVGRESANQKASKPLCSVKAARKETADAPVLLPLLRFFLLTCLRLLLYSETLLTHSCGWLAGWLAGWFASLLYPYPTLPYSYSPRPPKKRCGGPPPPQRGSKPPSIAAVFLSNHGSRSSPS